MCRWDGLFAIGNGDCVGAPRKVSGDPLDRGNMKMLRWAQKNAIRWALGDRGRLGMGDGRPMGDSRYEFLT